MVASFRVMMKMGVNTVVKCAWMEVMDLSEWLDISQAHLSVCDFSWRY